MAYTKSAQKAKRAAEKKRVFNLRRTKALKDSVKTLEKLAAVKKGSEAAKALPAAYQAIDKATKRGVLKANTAARMKSKLSKLVRA